MKKVLCAGLVAIGFATICAADEREAQVYDISVSVKTTTAKKGKLSPKTNKFVYETDSVIYRAQASQKWRGLIWGCDCNTLAGRWQIVDEDAGSVAGCVIWNNSKPNEVLFLDDVNWRLLNAIDKKGDKCEGSWTIGNMDEDSSAFLAFSGFGTLKVIYSSAPCEDPEVNCTSYLSMMSGNVAGWMPAPNYTTAGEEGSCTFCGDYDPGEEDAVDIATAWDFCPCEEYADVDHTAVSGTWTIKYNASSSKKLKKSASIVDAVKLPPNVKRRVERKIDDTLRGE